MGNCIRREVGLDIEEQPSQAEKFQQDLIEKVLNVKKDWKNRETRKKQHSSAFVTRNKIITEIDLSDEEDGYRKTKESAGEKFNRKKNSKFYSEIIDSKKFEEDQDMGLKM
jgi:hypothetical protein